MDDNDKIILKYKNVNLKNEHINRLRPNGWLNGDIVNFYIKIL